MSNDESHKNFKLMFVLFIVFRVLTLLLFRPGGFIRDYSDFNSHLGIATLSDYGLYPFLHFWLEWPPPIPWAMVGAYKLALLFPVWEDPRFWFVSILGLLFVAFEAGNFWLIYRLARQLFFDTEKVTRVLWLYALLFTPVYTMLGYFDGVALFFILLSLTFLLENRLSRAAIAAGIGFAVKLTPILSAGVAGWILWHRNRPDIQRVLTAWLKYALIFFALVGAILLPFALVAPQWLAGFARAVGGRSSWETVWAVSEGYFGFGVVAGDRLNPAETLFAVHSASLPWGLITLIFGAIFFAIFFKNVKNSSPRQMLAFAGASITLFLLYSKGYSPQFLVYVLLFIILLLPNGAGVGYAVTLMALNVLEQPIYFVILPDAHWLLTVIVWTRFVLFMALTLEFLRRIFAADAVKWDIALHRMRWALSAGGVVLILIFIPKGFSAYFERQLATNPYRAEIAFLQTQAGENHPTLLLDDQDLYRQFYPFLRHNFEMKLAGGDAKFAGAPTPNDLLADESVVWILSTHADGERLLVAADALAKTSTVFGLDGLGVLCAYDFSDGGGLPAPMAQSVNGIRLLNYRLERKDDALSVMLFWQSSDAVSADYTVFVQLLSPTGTLSAGHDSPPMDGASPTLAWIAGNVIADEHKIVLPEDLSAGEYRLIAGMYDSAGNRLMWDDNDFVSLHEIFVSTQ